ncbi:MAG TPA: exosortase H-associated membrane protein [Casimicrobiaceae bacterium]|nr:exosortase H-associated membrane protein [Casimicrobiaceae bacterium]
MSSPAAQTRAAASAGVRPFALRTLALLAPAFAVWYFAAPLLLFPAILIARVVARVGFGGLVRSVEESGSIATFVTTLHSAANGMAGTVTVDVNLLLYSFGLPLFAALTIAAHERRYKRHLAIGYVVLMPVVAFGAFADFLKNLAITSGPAVASQTGFGAWQREAIAFAFQFGSLILPAVAPAVLWIAMHRGFLTAVRAPARG